MLRAQMARQTYATIDTATRTEQASPHRLIELLYDELLSSLRQAEFGIAKDDLALKSDRLSRAMTILHGLESSLDFQRGGDVAENLKRVYDFCRREMLAGNSDNDAGRIGNAADAIGEIADAWRQIR